MIARIVCFLALSLLPALLVAQTRDPMWVLLSDNPEISLPRFETGASYRSDPEPSSPAEWPQKLITSPRHAGLGRLQDSAPDNPDRAGLGWQSEHVAVTFDLKKHYHIEAVELLLVSDAAPETIRISCRGDAASEWRPAGTLSNPTGAGAYWLLVPLQQPRRAAEVRIQMESESERLQVREIRVWGRLDEADPARLSARVDDRRGSLALIADGEARSVIVVGPAPPVKTMAAARLLQDMLYRMTGVMLPVVNHSARADLPRLLVGPAASARAGVTIPQMYPEDEQFVLRRSGRDIIIAGNDASPNVPGRSGHGSIASDSSGRRHEAQGFYGTMMAVCAFLELHGARFYRWDDVDNYLITPRRSGIHVASLDRTERPAFARRSMSNRPGTYTPYRELWRIWNRIGGVHMSYAHNRFVAPETFRTHPEYFAMINGARVDPKTTAEWQLCVSNPEVIRLASDQAAAQFRAFPSLRSYALSARDNLSFCECSHCRSQPGNQSDRWSAFANAVRTDFDQRHPEFADRTFVFYAYWGTSNPPVSVKLLPGIQAMFIGDGCHAHTWQSPHEDCGNHAMLRKLAGWKTASPSGPVLIYDWYIPATGTGASSHRWRTFPWFTYAKPFVDARFWRRQGAPVVNIEIDGELDDIALHWLPYYMLTRALWDPGRPADAALDDMCVTLYGSASGTMRNVFAALEDALAEADVHATTWRMPDPHALYSETLRQDVAILLARARNQTVSEPRAQARVRDVARLWNEGWKALAVANPALHEKETYNPAIGK